MSDDNGQELIYPRHHCTMLRLVLQSQTALSIGTGRGDGIFDNLLVRDANGLPGIPGTSLAGVLRHLFWTHHGEAQTEDLFGSSVRERQRASRLHISWGFIHNQNDQCLDGLLMGDDLSTMKDDPILAEAIAETPVRRNHVRLDHRGTAADGAQFDRVALHAGHRFSVELTFWSEHANDPAFTQLKQLLLAPGLRLGGGTRRGFGALRVVRAHQRAFDLKKTDDFNAYSKIGPDLNQVEGFTPIKLKEPNTQPRVTLNLTPLDGYRFGGGHQPLGDEQQPAPKLIPVCEEMVVWENNRANMAERRLLIPASGIKGALRHRFAFHFHRLSGTWAEDGFPYEDIAECPGLRTVFGFAADDKDDEGLAGLLLIDDLYLKLPQQVATLTHNGIDRFTGGVRNHVLYSEQMVSEPISLVMNIQDPNKRLLEPHLLPALEATLQDLAEGRLALGAAGSRGWGSFSGTVSWTNDEVYREVRS